MNRYAELDHIANQFPLGSCVKSYHDNIYGRVVSWTLYGEGKISLDIVTVPGHYLSHMAPSWMTIIQPSAMPDYHKEDHHVQTNLR